jgi:cobalt-zinc-cadmium efflux system outer membrane protein
MLAEALLLLAAQQPDTLSLEAALARAHQHRPQVQAARALTQEARARLGIAGTVPNPLLQFKHVTGAGSEEAILEQRSDWLFLRWSERSSARAGIRAAEADSSRLAALISREVRVAFYEALAGLETVRITRSLQAATDSLARFAADRVSAGDLSALEREQFGVEAGRVRQLLSRAEERSRVALAGLAQALGQSFGLSHPSGPLDDGLDQPWPGPPDPEILPFLTRALADSARDHSLATSATLRRFPYPSLRLGREWNSGGPFGGQAAAIVGFAVPIPIWNVGTGPARLARAAANRSAAAAGEARLEAARLLLAGETRLAASRERALVTRDSLLPRAERLRAGAVRLYRAGQTGVLPLFDALRAEREIALGYVQDLLAWQTALADWLALLGRTE